MVAANLHEALEIYKRFTRYSGREGVAVRAAIIHAFSDRTEVMAMAPRTILRVWYGKRWGMPQSFEEIGNYDGAANFAAFIEADRIEVVREPATLPALEMAA